MASGWLAGLVGGLQGLQQGIQQNYTMLQQQREEDLRFLSYWAQHGDEATQKIALQGIADMHAKSGGFKALFKGGGPHPAVAQIRSLLGSQMGPPGPSGIPAMPAAGSAVPAMGSVMAGPIAPSEGGPPGPPSTIPGGMDGASPAGISPPGGGSAWGGRTAPTITAPKLGPAMPPTGAALPTTSPTIAPGAPRAGAIAPAGMMAPGGELEQITVGFERLGVGKPPPPPTAEAVRDRVAKEFGHTATELEDPNFGFTNHMRDPAKEKLQNEYRSRLQQEVSRETSTYRSEESSFAAGVRTAYAQLMQTGRAETSAREAESRREKSAQAAEGRADRRQREYEARQEKRDAEIREREAYANLQKARTQANRLLNPKSFEERVLLKHNRAQIEAQAAAMIEDAETEYRVRTQKEPPGVRFGTGAASGTQLPAAPPAAPSAAPPTSPAGVPAAGRATAPARGPGGFGPPPLAQVTPMEEQRAAQLLATLRRRGEDSLDSLSLEDQNFLRDYMTRKKSMLGLMR